MWHELYFLIDVIRERLEFPALLRKAIDLYCRWQQVAPRRPEVVVEDAGTGTALVQSLRDCGIFARPMTPDADKVVRMSAQSLKIENGQVFLPRGAPWLNDFRTEVLAFPNGSYDDQIDSMSQAIKYLTSGRPLRVVA